MSSYVRESHLTSDVARSTHLPAGRVETAAIFQAAMKDGSINIS